jgi:hypothetical protein
VLSADLPPPTAYGCQSKGGSIMVCANDDPNKVAIEIVNLIGIGTWHVSAPLIFSPQLVDN